MKEVTQKEFFALLYAACDKGPDIMPRIVSPWPYKMEWVNQKSTNSQVYGISQDLGDHLGTSRYYWEVAK